MGRRAHAPTPISRRQVEAMAAYGVPETDIAKVLAIDPKTLRKHYRTELDTGAVKATAKVAEFLYRKATTEGAQCVTAAIFWLKTRGGWKETVVQENTGETRHSYVVLMPEDTGRRALHGKAASALAVNTLFHTSSRSLPRGQPDQHRKAGHG